MSGNAVEIDELYKGYAQDELVLKGLSMRVPTGSIYGFIGQNGSGKSTTLNTLMGLLQPQDGRVKILNDNAWGISAATKARIAYVPEVSFHFSWLTVREMMNFVAQFYPSWNPREADELLAAIELPADKKINSLSLGQSRSVSIITALSCNPDLLILDEPAGNLDVVARRLFQQHIIDFARQEGKSVLLSSHVLTDLERVIDRVGIIRGGKIIVEDELDNLKERLTYLRLIYNGEPPKEIDVPNTIHTERYKNEVRLTVDGCDEQQLRHYPSLAQARIEVQTMSLEEIFVAYSSSAA